MMNGPGKPPRQPANNDAVSPNKGPNQRTNAADLGRGNGARSKHLPQGRTDPAHPKFGAKAGQEEKLAAQLENDLLSVVFGSLLSKGGFDNLEQQCRVAVENMAAGKLLKSRVAQIVNDYLADKRWDPSLDRSMARNAVHGTVSNTFTEIAISHLADEAITKLRPEITKVITELYYSHAGLEKPRDESSSGEDESDSEGELQSWVAEYAEKYGGSAPSENASFHHGQEYAGHGYDLETPQQLASPSAGTGAASEHLIDVIHGPSSSPNSSAPFGSALMEAPQPPPLDHIVGQSSTRIEPIDASPLLPHEEEGGKPPPVPESSPSILPSVSLKLTDIPLPGEPVDSTPLVRCSNLLLLPPPSPPDEVPAPRSPPPAKQDPLPQPLSPLIQQQLSEKTASPSSFLEEPASTQVLNELSAVPSVPAPPPEAEDPPAASLTPPAIEELPEKTASPSSFLEEPASTQVLNELSAVPSVSAPPPEAEDPPAASLTPPPIEELPEKTASPSSFLEEPASTQVLNELSAVPSVSAPPPEVEDPPAASLTPPPIEELPEKTASPSSFLEEPASTQVFDELSAVPSASAPPPQAEDPLAASLTSPPIEDLSASSASQLLTPTQEVGSSISSPLIADQTNGFSETQNINLANAAEGDHDPDRSSEPRVLP